MDITDDQIGGCGVEVGPDFCPCADYEHHPAAADGQGEPLEDFCTCGHHRVMHATIA